MDDPADEADELSDIIEFGRRADDFVSGKEPTNEFRNFGAVSMKWKIVIAIDLRLFIIIDLPLPSCEKLIDLSLI